MFINYSNHPSALWSKEQLTAAAVYGQIRDIPFLSVSPDLDEYGVSALAEQEYEKIMALQPDAVMCQGEFSLTFALIDRLLDAHIPVFAACSQRETKERITDTGETERISTFRFIRFRQYTRGEAEWKM